MATIADVPAVIDALETHGNYCIALNNISDFRQRFIPVRRFSPEAMTYLKSRGIAPQLIYIDSFKEDRDLYMAHELFPAAIICGDDWLWRESPQGPLKMQENVKKFAAEKGFTIRSEGHTWILDTAA